jgi:hypothetical protein
MFTDVETRRLIAAEHVAQLRLAAADVPRPRRTRRWIAVHLIAAGERLRPDSPGSAQRPLRAS